MVVSTEPANVDIEHACDEISKHLDVLIKTHREISVSEASRSSQRHAGVIERMFKGVISQLAQYEGTRAMASAIFRSGVSKDASIQATWTSKVKSVVPTGAPNDMRVHDRIGIFERSLEWEKKRQEKLEEERARKLEEELTPLNWKRRPSKWDHVQSVMKQERIRKELLRRQQEVEEARRLEEEARVEAERVARDEAEQALREEAMADDKAIEEAIRQEREAEERRRLDAARRARDAALRAQREAEAAQREVRETFGDKGLDRRPSMPGKLVWRVAPPTLLSGNVMHEYRVKDHVTKTKGVSFIMGQTRDSAEDIVQCVLFDDKEFDPLKAARWVQQYGPKFTSLRPTVEPLPPVPTAGQERQEAPGSSGTA